ncbi:MAG: FAD-binding protein [Planctomycetes bacterium]|nr:FAD-binding protein [Planctomycetota bacterium]
MPRPSEQCDVLIVGAGPAGLAAAHRLLHLTEQSVLLLEQGKSLSRRTCPQLTTDRCPPCRQCDFVSGVGGVAGIVGGSLCFFPAGERLAHHTGYACEAANAAVIELIKEAEQCGMADDLRLRCGLPKHAQLRDVGAMHLKRYCAVPLLADEMRPLMAGLISSVEDSGGRVITRASVTQIMRSDPLAGFRVIYSHQGVPKAVIVRKAVLLCVGRSGASWLESTLESLGLPHGHANVDVGVRLEMPASLVQNIAGSLEDPKFKASFSDVEFRTLCWCRGGQMAVAHLDGVRMVDGHFGTGWTERTSVSLVGRLPVPARSNPVDFALSHFACRNPREKGPFRQQLDLFLGRPRDTAPIPSPECPPALNSIEYDVHHALSATLREGIDTLLSLLNDESGGAIFSHPTGYVYAPVIDNFWRSVPLDEALMTDMPGVFIGGDLAGLGRGYVQAMFSGLVIAHAIAGVPLTSSVSRGVLAQAGVQRS